LINQRKQPGLTNCKYANENMPRFWVLVKIDGKWKIKHYVLSMTIPNKTVGAVIKIKEPIEDKLISVTIRQIIS
jgi:hypothetical protein